MEFRRSDSDIRGPLTQGFWAALTTSDVASLVLRFGPAASLQLPGVETLSSLAEIESSLAALASKLKDRTAHFEHVRTVRGTERDATLGVLWFGQVGARVPVRTLVVCEKRAERHICVRVYLPRNELFPASASARTEPDPRHPAQGAGLGKELAWAIDTRDFASFQKLLEQGATLETSSGERATEESYVTQFDAWMRLELQVTSSMDTEDVSLVETWSLAANERIAFFAQRGASSLVSKLRVFGPDSP
jgi:hypothetical protein